MSHARLYRPRLPQSPYKKVGTTHRRFSSPRPRTHHPSTHVTYGSRPRPCGYHRTRHARDSPGPPVQGDQEGPESVRDNASPSVRGFRGGRPSCESRFFCFEGLRTKRTNTGLCCRCERCRMMKVKCSGAEPCARCQRAKERCFFAAESKRISVSERYVFWSELRI